MQSLFRNISISSSAHKCLGMPYMGSKRKLADKIVDVILRDNPDTETEKYYDWIDRETFNQNKDKDTWLGINAS